MSRCLTSTDAERMLCGLHLSRLPHLRGNARCLAGASSAIWGVASNMGGDTLLGAYSEGQARQLPPRECPFHPMCDRVEQALSIADLKQMGARMAMIYISVGFNGRRRVSGGFRQSSTSIAVNLSADLSLTTRLQIECV